LSVGEFKNSKKITQNLTQKWRQMQAKGKGRSAFFIERSALSQFVLVLASKGCVFLGGRFLEYQRSYRPKKRDLAQKTTDRPTDRPTDLHWCLFIFLLMFVCCLGPSRGGRKNKTRNRRTSAPAREKNTYVRTLFFFIVRFWAFLGKGSSKHEKKNECVSKTITGEIFFRGIFFPGEMRNLLPFFLSTFFVALVKVPLGNGTSKT
jgi:hypothetical protein